MIKLLVIDDSAYNRKVITSFFKNHHQVEVVGTAADGQEGLAQVIETDPQVITLDLEMPRLDGFGFLRLLMSSQPTPVIVISSHANKENVFRALELGAIDFVAKPGARISKEIEDIRGEVVQKVLSAGKYNLQALRALSSVAPATGLHVAPNFERSDEAAHEPAVASRVVVMGASTGGPASLTRILGALPQNLEAGIVIAQHMPPKFTATFAERLNRICRLEVVEMRGRAPIKKGCVYLAPGDGDLLVQRAKEGGYKVRMVPLLPENRYNPNVDRLFLSAADAVGDQLLGVVLTGMGDDGATGAAEVARRGGRVLVESEESAVVFGMPKSVIEAGVPARVRPLSLMATQILRFARTSGMGDR